MKLEITPGSSLKNVTPEQISDTLEDVYEGILVAATLVADDTKHRYLMASTGGYLEYSETKKAPVYQSENNPLEKCKAIFLTYLEGGTGWKNEIEWVKKKSEKNANLPGGWVVTDWNKLNAETLAWETDPKHQRVCPPLLQHMKITGKKKLLAALTGVIITCAFCALSVYFYPRLEPAISGQIFAEAMFVLVWTCLAGIGSAIFHTEKIQPRFYLYANLIVAVMFTAGIAWLSAYTRSVFSAAFISALLSGGLVIFFIGRNILNEIEYRRNSIIGTGNQPVILHYLKSVIDVTGNSSNNPVETHFLGFYYLDKYKTGFEIPKETQNKYAKALEQNRLSVQARYLPNKPWVHTAHAEII